MMKMILKCRLKMGAKKGETEVLMLTPKSYSLPGYYG